MKKILLILILGSSLKAFGQPGPNVLAKYKKTERLGNFLTRWYFDIAGTSLAWKEQLTLYSDSTYRYIYQGGECATFDMNTSGKWTIKDNVLILNEEQKYRIVNKKLYSSEPSLVNNQTWVMKKVN